MIKRRSYKLDHGDRDAPSESSSSSSDSELETKATEEDQEQENHEEEDDDKDDYKDSSEGYKNNRVTEMQKQNITGSSSSGYESEESSANEVNLDSSGPPTSDDDIETIKSINDRKSISENHLFSRGIGESENIQHKTVTKVDNMPCERSNYILKHKSVFKCRICPRIVCLSEETLNIHLKSKRHARSEKLLKDGRLKLMLNDNGKIDGEKEHSSRKEKTVQVTKRKKGFKRQRWGKRSRKTL